VRYSNVPALKQVKGFTRLPEKLICQKYKKVAFASTGHKTAIFTRLRCKQWSCEACAKTNAWIWRNWLLKRIPEVSEQWWLLTLTANRHKRTAWGSLDNIRSNLDRLFKRVKRVFGGIEYVRVFEKHPTSQAIHCHIIISGLSPYVAVGYSAKLRPMAVGVLKRTGRNGVWSLKTWIKKIAQELDMGFIADIQLIIGDAAKAVWYVCKYLTKSQEDLHVKGLRHVQVTKGIGSPQMETLDLVWQTAYYITAKMLVPNASVVDINTGRTIDNNYWEHTNYYPDD
jgi:hypothetical protein